MLLSVVTGCFCFPPRILQRSLSSPGTSIETFVYSRTLCWQHHLFPLQNPSAADVDEDARHLGDVFLQSRKGQAAQSWSSAQTNLFCWDWTLLGASESDASAASDVRCRSRILSSGVETRLCLSGFMQVIRLWQKVNVHTFNFWFECFKLLFLCLFNMNFFAFHYFWAVCRKNIKQNTKKILQTTIKRPSVNLLNNFQYLLHPALKVAGVCSSCPRAKAGWQPV